MYRTAADLVEKEGSQALAEMVAQAPVPAIFTDLAEFPPAPDVMPELLPSVMRGASAADLPPEHAIARLSLPVLILAWPDDPGHPLSTAERLMSLISGARLQVAHSSAELREWGAVSAEFLTT